MRAKEKRLAKGHHLYMELISGGNIMLWKRQDIIKIMNLSEGALRTLKSRTKQQRNFLLK